MRENTAYFCGYFFMFKKLICGIFAVAGDFKTPFYSAGITEELKSTDFMHWIGLVNNVRNAAEEIVLKELVYV